MPIADEPEVGQRRAAARLRQERAGPRSRACVELRARRRAGWRRGSVTGRPLRRAASMLTSTSVRCLAVISTAPRPNSREHRRRAPSTSSSLGAAARHRLAVAAEVRRRLRGREAERAGAHRLAQQLAHARDLLRRRGALGGRVVEHVVAQRRVADQRADVERRPHRRDRVEVLAGSVSQSQVMPLRSAGRLMPSTRSSMRMMRSRPAGLARREREAAVAHHDAGDAVPARRRQRVVPADLRVVVRVRIDEAGADGEPGRRRSRACRRPARPPTCVRRSPSIATSPVCPGAPLPSMIVPPRMTRSCAMVPPPAARRARPLLACQGRGKRRAPGIFRDPKGPARLCRFPVTPLQ